MLQTTIDNFYNKYRVSVAFEFSMASNDATLTMSLGYDMERTFYINNFFPTTEQEVINLLESIYRKWIKEVEDYCNEWNVDWTRLRWRRCYETLDR